MKKLYEALVEMFKAAHTNENLVNASGTMGLYWLTEAAVLEYLAYEVHRELKNESLTAKVLDANRATVRKYRLGRSTEHRGVEYWFTMGETKALREVARMWAASYAVSIGEDVASLPTEATADFRADVSWMDVKLLTTAAVLVANENNDSYLSRLYGLNRATIRTKRGIVKKYKSSLILKCLS